MASLSINYEATMATGRELMAKGLEFETLLKKVNGIGNDLDSSWKGSDAAKYSQKLQSQCEEMKKLSVAITELGEFLVKVSNAYQNTMETNNRIIN